MDSNTCPEDQDETAEAYVMNQMDLTEASAFQVHFAQCKFCWKAVEDARAYVKAMRDASQKFLGEDD
jgi:hypothetical protein